MENKIESLDMTKTIGRVVLSDGKTRLEIPKLTIRKIIQIVKFLGMDGARLWSQLSETLGDRSIDEYEKIAIVFDELKEEQLIRIMSIMLEMDDNQTLQFDPEEMIDILLVYSEKVDFSNLYQKIRQLMKKMFNKEIPEFGALMDKAFPKTDPAAEQPDPEQPKDNPEANLQTIQPGAASKI